MSPLGGVDRIRRARHERKVKRAGRLWDEAAPPTSICGRCGALVYERTWHREWHGKIEGGGR